MFKASLVLVLFVVLVAQATDTAKHPTKYKMFLFPEECFDKFFVNFDFTDSSCIAKTLSKCLSTGIVVFSALLKLPQIIKIMQNSSVAGLSIDALYVEMFMFTFNTAYNIHKGNDFMLYGENLFILVQNFIILYLFTIYDKSIKITSLLGRLVLYFVIAGPILTQYVPEVLFTYSIYINMILMLLSRGPQIRLNHKNKSTGQLAFITQFLNFAGTLARTFTIMVSSGDLLYNAQNFEALILNFTIVFQMIIYRHNTISAKTK